MMLDLSSLEYLTLIGQSQHSEVCYSMTTTHSSGYLSSALLSHLSYLGLQRGGTFLETLQKFPEDYKKSWKVSNISGIFFVVVDNFHLFATLLISQCCTLSPVSFKSICYLLAPLLLTVFTVK